MPEERPRQLGLDVTDFVLARVDNYRPSVKQQRAMTAIMPDKARAALLAPLVFGAAAEAMAQYQVNGERGILLCDRTYPHQVQLWYVPQADYPAVLGRVTEVTRQDIAQLLAAYDPATESVVVVVTVETAQAIQVTTVVHYTHRTYGRARRWKSRPVCSYLQAFAPDARNKPTVMSPMSSGTRRGGRWGAFIR